MHVFTYMSISISSHSGFFLQDPYQELLLWAIFSRRGQLARFLWERCETPLCAAVVASCVYQSLWKSLGAKNTVILNEYQKQKTMFETLAVEVRREGKGRGGERQAKGEKQ